MRLAQPVADMSAYLQKHGEKDILRFITCGSVDDGKSSLIGRLLYESKMIFEDQLSELERDSKKMGKAGERLDLALLVDGLAAEREQGITIDVAYRFFSTDKRRFIIADTPGHEQYTRNMATGASTADLAIVLIDATKGVLPQTRRHSFIVSLMGVRHVVLAVNKMDMVGYSEDVFNKIVEDYKALNATLGIGHIEAIPMSALMGDNFTAPSDRMPWYKGALLLPYLETVQIERMQNFKASDLRMPVQWVNRPDQSFRGFSGRIVGGAAEVGQDVRILPSGMHATIREIVTLDGKLDRAVSGQSVTIVLDKEVDVSRGDVIAAADNPCETADQFSANILWMSEHPMIPSRQYLLQLGTVKAVCTPTRIKHKIDISDLAHIPAETLEMNEIAEIHISLDRMIPFMPYDENREMGGFILIDRATNETVATGMIRYAMRRSKNIFEHHFTVDADARAGLKNQKPCVLWFTGLSGSGKSTIANILEQKLYQRGHHTMVLDGDNVRHGLNRDLGFTDQDRAENIRRIAEVSKLMTEAGLITLVSFISPFAAERQMARELIGDAQFVEIFVSTPLAVAEARDVKGLYKKARAGQIPNFTGIGSPYEAPENPDMTLDTTQKTAEELADTLLRWLEDREFIPALG